MTQEIQFRIKRQDGPDAAPYWEAFRMPYAPQHNVVSALMYLREHPVNAAGKKVRPVAWECNCMEACPQFNESSKFIGPAPLAQVRLHNSHPTGQYDKEDRLHAIMGEGGITDCGNAQNCVQVCPKEIPLTTAIGELGRQTTAQWFRDLFSR